jgi:hypothetical protein
VVVEVDGVAVGTLQVAPLTEVVAGAEPADVLFPDAPDAGLDLDVPAAADIEVAPAQPAVIDLDVPAPVVVYLQTG